MGGGLVADVEDDLAVTDMFARYARAGIDIDGEGGG